MKTKPQARKKPKCSLCGQENQPGTLCEGGYVCQECFEKFRQGRDNTTRAVKTLKRSIRGQAEKARTEFNGGVIDEQMAYDIESAELLAADALQHSSAVTIVDGGEVLPQHDPQLIDTLATPGTTALDASADRLGLITVLGNDVAAMALDASETMQASNSVEKMLAHQLAVCHDSAMRFISKGNLEQDPVHAVRMMNLAVRLMETYQKGLLTWKRLQGTGEQRITIQHVNVTQGGQAVIGQLTPGGGSKK